MYLLYKKADYQRRVWRQLSGTHLDSILLPTEQKLYELIRFVPTFEKFLQQNLTDPLTNQLEKTLERMKSGFIDIRNEVDIIFLETLSNNISGTHIDNKKQFQQRLLRNFYNKFLEELTKSTEKLE